MPILFHLFRKCEHTVSQGQFWHIQLDEHVFFVHSVYKRPQPASDGWGDKDLPNGHLAGDKRGRSNLGVSEDARRGREGQ